MAVQFKVTIYSVNGALQSKTMSFPASDCMIIEQSGGAMIDYKGDKYYTNTTISTLVALANDVNASMVQATIVNVNGIAQTASVQMAFPSERVKIFSTNNITGANSAIQFWNVFYYATETTNELVTAANESSGGGSSSYLVYTALLSQSGTSAPVATVLTNTLGGTVVWGYDGVGFYSATLTGAFVENKTFILFGTDSSYYGNIQWGDANTVYIYTYDVNGVSANGILSNGGAFLEIRVYP